MGRVDGRLVESKTGPGPIRVHVRPMRRDMTGIDGVALRRDDRIDRSRKRSDPVDAR